MGSLVFDYGLVFFSFWVLLWFLDVFKCLGWMQGVCWVWVGSGTEWSPGVVWVWPWEVLLSWWSGPQAHHVYPPTTILVPSCPSIRLADLLANEEIPWARVGHVISGIPMIYFEFIQTQLHGSLARIFVTSVFPFPPEVKFSSCMLLSHISALWQYLHKAN